MGGNLPRHPGETCAPRLRGRGPKLDILIRGAHATQRPARTARLYSTPEGKRYTVARSMERKGRCPRSREQDSARAQGRVIGHRAVHGRDSAHLPSARTQCEGHPVVGCEHKAGLPRTAGHSADAASMQARRRRRPEESKGEPSTTNISCFPPTRPARRRRRQ
ncbi:hypothetical protein EXIGLDRAFT_318904 [Exidia glandulosa HHB12029]|uniref:Uncharacterized protein n=1 Tax=Exidia glandulosa HHB12029 TaxID=1314781 RepID=A0A165Q3J3_EXIGL|nr:hypothetical protein EXIGLDRAFT_318904 [Exidia glandulosa HHB12029]